MRIPDRQADPDAASEPQLPQIDSSALLELKSSMKDVIEQAQASAVNEAKVNELRAQLRQLQQVKFDEALQAGAQRASGRRPSFADSVSRAGLPKATPRRPAEPMSPGGKMLFRRMKQGAGRLDAATSREFADMQV